MTSALHAQLRSLEFELLDPDVRRTPRAFELLSDAFIEFGSSGRTYTKEQVLEALRAEHAASWVVSNLQVRSLGETVALVTYVASRQGAPAADTRQRREAFVSGSKPTKKPRGQAACLVL